MSDQPESISQQSPEPPPTPVDAGLVAAPETTAVPGPNLADLEAEAAQLQAEIGAAEKSESVEPKPSEPATGPKAYRVVDQLTWEDAAGEQQIALPGEVRSDLLESSIPWLLQGGHIEDPDAPKEA